jgi:hypothetical protein
MQINVNYQFAIAPLILDKSEDEADETCCSKGGDKQETGDTKHDFWQTSI